MDYDLLVGTDKDGLLVYWNLGTQETHNFVRDECLDIPYFGHNIKVAAVQLNNDSNDLIIGLSTGGFLHYRFDIRKKGDVIIDSIIDILDIVSMVNVILSSMPTDCDLSNGDLNGDGIANINDLILLVNIILNSGRVAPIEGHADVSYIEHGDRIEITIDSDVDFSGVQIMYATDSEGSVELKDNSHIDRHSRYEGGVMRYVAYNTFNNPFDSHKAEFVITGSDIKAQDVLITVSSPTGHEVELSHEVAGNVYQTGQYRFELSGVYPNPFNPAAEISFTLPADGHVKLSVFNVKGQEVDVIFEGFQSIGSHQYRWDAGDQPSGVYYMRLMSGDQVETVKAVLMR